MAENGLNLLVTQCGQGNERAFRELYETVAPQLLAIAKRILKDHQQAEDVMQQTMMRVWRNAADYDSRRSQATTWLTSIVRYRAIDVLRQRNRQHEILRDDPQGVMSVLGHDEAFHSTDPISSTLADRLEFCFGEISRDQAGCIQLAYLDGLTYAEVSERLARSIGTVKSWMRRGLNKLRECVGQ